VSTTIREAVLLELVAQQIRDIVTDYGGGDDRPMTHVDAGGDLDRGLPDRHYTVAIQGPPVHRTLYGRYAVSLTLLISAHYAQAPGVEARAAQDGARVAARLLELPRASAAVDRVEIREGTVLSGDGRVIVGRPVVIHYNAPAALSENARA
jgi:hypothetical protein